MLTTAILCSNGRPNNSSFSHSLLQKVTSHALALTFIALAGQLTIVQSNLRAPSNNDAELLDPNNNPRFLDMAPPKSLFQQVVSNRTLSPFGPDILKGYQSCNDFKADIFHLYTTVGNDLIQSQKDWSCYYDGSFNNTYYNNSILQTPFSQRNRRAQKKETSYGTNNQVPNVQEMELIQSDGQYIYVANGDTIQVSDLNGKVVTNITVSSPPPTNENQTTWVDFKSIFINKNILTAIASMSTCDYNNNTASCNDLFVALYYNFNARTKTLNLINQFNVYNSTGGYYGFFDMRNIGGYTYIVEMSHPLFDIYDGFFFDGVYDKLYRCSDFHRNMSAVEYETAALEFLSSYAKQHQHDAVTKILSEGAASSCKNVMKLFNDTVNGYYSTAITKVFSIGFNEKTTYHISRNAMLIESAPYLIKFTLKDSKMTPTSAGALDRSRYYLLNFDYYSLNYRIDFYNGYYRIATTSYNASFGENSAQIFIVRDNNSQLQVVGQVDLDLDLDYGSVQLARFTSDNGFIVTSTTNLYSNESKIVLNVLNLTSPSNPRLIAAQALSDYLQNIYPIENGKYFLSVEYVVSIANASGITVRMFQVTDKSVEQVGKPSEVIQESITPHVWSEAVWDHRAFRYLPRTRKLIIPVHWVYYNYYNSTVETPSNYDGFFVYDVDLVKGVRLIGNVTHDYHSDGWCASYNSRSMVFNGDLVTIMDNSIKRTSTVSSLSNSKWVLYLGCPNGYYHY